MLVLTRCEHQVICIGNDITVTIVRIEHDQVRLGINAPPDVDVDRQEVRDAIELAGGRRVT